MSAVSFCSTMMELEKSISRFCNTLNYFDVNRDKD